MALLSKRWIRALVLPTHADIAEFRVHAQGRVVSAPGTFPSEDTHVHVTLAAAYWPQGGANSIHARSTPFGALQAEVAEAVLSILEDSRSAGRPLPLGTDANAIASMRDTWSTIAARGPTQASPDGYKQGCVTPSVSYTRTYEWPHITPHTATAPPDWITSFPRRHNA